MTVLQHKKKPVPRVIPTQASNITNEIPPIQLNANNYSDCFSMALKFINPFKAFVELQKAFGLKVIEIPDTLQQELKPEYKFS